MSLFERSLAFATGRHAVFRPNPRRAARRIARAEEALAGGAAQKAEALAMSALLAAPARLDGHSLLGRALDAQGRAGLALECHRGRVPEALRAAHLGPVRPSPEGPPGPLRRVRVTGGDRNEAPGTVDRIPGGRVWLDAHHTRVLDRDGRPFEALTSGGAVLVDHLLDRSTPVRARGRAIVLGARSSGNYYHWMVDVLPKLELCRLAGIERRADDVFLLPARPNAFQREGLAALGVASCQVHVANRRSPYVVADELIVPRLDHAMATRMGGWLPAFLRATFLPDGANAPARRRLFVSRDPARSQGRGVDNLAEVHARFVARGFEVVHPETLDVVAQARLFAEAAVIAGPHGAGLTNLVFCAPGARVIEFHGAHLAPCYRAMCALGGLDHHALGCKADSPERDDDGARARSLATRRAASFPIDLEAACALLDRVGVR